MTKAVQPLVDKSVLVELRCAGELQGWGSGTWMTGQTVVTADHVTNNVPAGCSLTVKHYGKTMGAQVIKRDIERDISTLFIPAAHSAPMQTITREPLLGENITCVSYGVVMVDRLTPHLSVTKGNIAGFGLPGGYVRFTAPAMPGSSGGGCFADSDRALVLVIQAGHFPWGVPIDGMYYGRSVR